LRFLESSPKAVALLVLLILQLKVFGPEAKSGEQGDAEKGG